MRKCIECGEYFTNKQGQKGDHESILETGKCLECNKNKE